MNFTEGVEPRIARLEQQMSQLLVALNIEPYNSSCPADPCHVHYPHAVSQESWYSAADNDHVFVKGGFDLVCLGPSKQNPSYPNWPQRKVLIAHAPEMYRELLKASRQVHGDDVYFSVHGLLKQIQTELKEASTK